MFQKNTFIEKSFNSKGKNRAFRHKSGILYKEISIFAEDLDKAQVI